MVSVTKNRRNMLLLAIFSLAFLFRMAIILYNEYPPSSDIGLHGSIINLILDEEKLPLWNPYHMGGQVLSTPPGFHFFVSILILFSGMPLIFAQLITAGFFSSVIVFPAYLISKKIWKNDYVGILAAFFAAISALSLEMLSWGGYTNIISLTLMVIILYLFLNDINKPNYYNLLIGSILFGSLILSHTFSLFVIFPILTLYFFFLLIIKILKLKKIDFKNKIRFFTFSIATGALIISPWLLRVMNFYMNASTSGSFLGGIDYNRNLILANRTVDIIILGLFVALIPTFFMLKASRKSFFDSKSGLIIAWFIVPLIMTQAYIFGIFIDYSRFMYFIDFPGIIIISAGLFYLFNYISSFVSKFSGIRDKKILRLIFIQLCTLSLIFFMILSVWSIFYPQNALERVDFYTTIQKPEFIAIDWIQTRTPESSVLVADHLYGWWLSGISKRPTLSAAGLEFLIYGYEMEVARNAMLNLDTNYYMNNGLIQVKDTISLHNPDFSIEKWDGKSYSLFNFQNNGTVFWWYWIDKDYTLIFEETTLADMEVIESTMLIKDENSTEFIVTYTNDYFNVEKIVILKRGARFAEVIFNIEIPSWGTNLYNIWLPVYVGEGKITITNADSVKKFSLTDHNNDVSGMVRLVKFKEDFRVQMEKIDGPNRVQMLFQCPGSRKINIEFLVGIFDSKGLTQNQIDQKYFSLFEILNEDYEDYPETETWDYLEMIQKYNVSFVVSRDQNLYSKFSKDPKFQFVFNSGNVTIFQVKK